MYAIHTGMYHDSIKQDSAWGLPTEWALLPTYLSKLGNYSTHAVGKWDIGHAAWELTPTERGFDTFHGYYGERYTRLRDARERFAR
jgi:arylsulfatase A-like enzyme